MLTVVRFTKSLLSDRKRNSIITHTLGKVGFIDNRGSKPKDGKPRQGESWVVEIIRENLSVTGGGCFIIQPIQKLTAGNVVELIHGMYDVERYHNSLVLCPHPEHGTTTPWYMTTEAKMKIQQATNMQGIVIPYGPFTRGTDYWPRRRPAEEVLASELRRIRDPSGD